MENSFKERDILKEYFPIKQKEKERKMKLLKKIILIFLLLIIFIYTLAIDNMPNEIVIFEGEKININTILGLNLSLLEENNSIETISSDVEKVSDKIGKTKLKVNLFNTIQVKDVDVEVIPKTKVIPIGSIAGVKLYTSGVLVVGMSEIEGIDSKKYKPYEDTGIKEGDSIVKIGEKEITSTEELIEVVNNSKGQELDVEYIHQQETLECSIKPVQTAEDEYKIGLWVRDSAAGVGTVTFYEPSTKNFGALGHGITDIDTQELIDIASGEFVTTRILNITKGEKGNPRENTRNYR